MPVTSGSVPNRADPTPPDLCSSVPLSSAESGLFLQRVQVKSVKEAWWRCRARFTCLASFLRVSIQIVRRSRWLNEIICGHTQTPESSDSFSSKEPAAANDEDEASEADLLVVRAGLFLP